MSAQSDPPAIPDERAALLLEAAQVLLEELDLLAEERWVEVPELKRKKVVIASRLRQLRAETESADGAPATALESLIADLEKQSRRKIRHQLRLISFQILALQELSLYLNESLHITLQRTANRPLGNGDVVS